MQAYWAQEYSEVSLALINETDAVNSLLAILCLRIYSVQVYLSGQTRFQSSPDSDSSSGACRGPAAKTTQAWISLVAN